MFVRSFVRYGKYKTHKHTHTHAHTRTHTCTDTNMEYLNSSKKGKTNSNKINYASHVQKPEDVTKMKNFFSVIFNVRDAFDYAKSSLVNGYDCRGRSLTIGDKYFVKSGFCGEESVPECVGKTRHLYIDNVPRNTPPCMDESQPIHERCRKNQNSGIIPGILQDAAEINPFELMYSSMGKGSKVSNKCVLRREKVGYETGERKKYHYETKCSPKKAPLICSVKLKEEFTNRNTHTKKSCNQNTNYTTKWMEFTLIIIIILLSCVVFVYRMVRK